MSCVVLIWIIDHMSCVVLVWIFNVKLFSLNTALIVNFYALNSARLSLQVYVYCVLMWLGL